MTRIVGLVVAVLLLGSCQPGVRTRCERVCKLETSCAEETGQVAGDYSPCVEACTALERDPTTHLAVDAHLKCVLDAPSCPAALACPP